MDEDRRGFVHFSNSTFVCFCFISPHAVFCCFRELYYIQGFSKLCGSKSETACLYRGFEDVIQFSMLRSADNLKSQAVHVNSDLSILSQLQLQLFIQIKSGRNITRLGRNGSEVTFLISICVHQFNVDHLSLEIIFSKQMTEVHQY